MKVCGLSSSRLNKPYVFAVGQAFLPVQKMLLKQFRQLTQNLRDRLESLSYRGNGKPSPMVQSNRASPTSISIAMVRDVPLSFSSMIRQLAQAIAFEQALTSSTSLVERFVQRRSVMGGNAGLINIATDGETYGHHHKFGELCLAYALEVDAPARGFAITNYGDYLDQHPPELEVEINNGERGEGSSWSCVHGVSRWIRDCGCQTGGEPGWNQAWRGPLRAALDVLRDEAAVAFAATRGELFSDPWAARDDAIRAGARRTEVSRRVSSCACAARS